MRWATEEHEPRIVLATIKIIRRAMAGKDSMASRIGRPFPAKTGLLYAPQFGKHLVPQLLEREMPKPVPRQKPNAERRRALELLAASRDGCTEAVMIAHGFTVQQMVDLVRAGLATAKTERVVAGGRTMQVAQVRITEAGRRALENAGQKVRR